LSAFLSVIFYYYLLVLLFLLLIAIPTVIPPTDNIRSHTNILLLSAVSGVSFSSVAVSLTPALPESAPVSFEPTSPEPAPVSFEPASPEPAPVSFEPASPEPAPVSFEPASPEPVPFELLLSAILAILPQWQAANSISRFSLHHQEFHI
jgi:hypothetical protein